MFQPNSVIANRYQVIRLVGQGGMSNLYLAYDRKYNNAIVVVKEMTAAYSDPKEQQMAVELFHREAKLLASLNHRHIPKVYDYFQFAGKYYLSMEFIDGEDLAQKLEAKKGPLPEDQVLEWGEQIATVLFYLHKHEPPIVFRDVKPSNIMLCDQGVKLIDFGIARHFDQAKKGDTMRIGSPGYAPPEQYAAQTDPRSDIYALGVTLHHALTGRDPTATSTPFLVPPARSLNPALRESTAAMLARATQLDPADRYQNVLEMKNDIKAILSRDKQHTRVVGAPPPPPGPAVSTSPSGAAPAAATNTAANPAGSPNATSGTAAAATVAPANSGATPPVNPNAATTSTNPAQPPQKGKRRIGRWLLAATALLALGGGLFAAGPDGREKLLTRASGLLASLQRSSNDSGSEESIRQLLLSGDPNQLLPLSQGAQLADLTEEKQPLYRLNLLAASISSSPPQVLHFLYPDNLVDTPREKEILQGSAQALAAINGQGGLDKKLYLVLPRAYRAGGLSSALKEIASNPTAGPTKTVVVDSGTEVTNLKEQVKKPDLVLTSPPSGTEPWLGLIQDQTVSSLFSLKPDEKILWAAPGPAPDKSEKVELSEAQANLEKLLERSVSEKATLVLEAERLTDPGSVNSGRVLLLAVGTNQLPKLGEKAKADAVVLGSPLRSLNQPTGKQRLFISPSEGLNLSEATVFDSVSLAVLPKDSDYLGLTLRRLPDGQKSSANAVRYRWTPSGWVPVIGETRKP